MELGCAMRGARCAAMATQKQPNPAAPPLPVANHPFLVCTEEQASSRAGNDCPRREAKGSASALGDEKKSFCLWNNAMSCLGFGGKLYRIIQKFSIFKNYF